MIFFHLVSLAQNFLHLTCPHKFSNGLSLKIIIILKAVKTPVNNWCINLINVWSVRSIHCTVDQSCVAKGSVLYLQPL